MPNDFIGFVYNGLRKGCYAKENGTNNIIANMISDMVSDLGTAIRNFIVAHTDEEFTEMSHKVAQLRWVNPSEVESFDETAIQHLHFPPLPTRYWFLDFKHEYSDLYSPYTEESGLSASDYRLISSRCLARFRSYHPDFPREIDGREIIQRYIPAPFSRRVKAEKWAFVPEFDEIIETSYHEELLDRIWDGRQKFVIDGRELEKDARWIYWVDFDNQVVEIIGMIEWSRDSVTVPFAEMVVGKLCETVERIWWSKHQEELETATAELDTVD